MENQIVQLLSRALDESQEESIYSEINELIEDLNSILELINIAGNENYPLNIQILSLILIRQMISTHFPTFTDQNYLSLHQISEQIEEKLTPIFYRTPIDTILISQYAALCCFLLHRLNFFYYFGTTELQIADLQIPSFYSNITEILIELIQNEELFQNSFTIAIEFLTFSEENQIDSFINTEFCQYVYPYLFQSNLSSRSIQILNQMKDYSIISNILENLNELNQNESVIQFIKLLSSFYLSIINSSEFLKSDGFQLFESVFEFILNCISQNDENELNSISFEAIIFILNLMNSFSPNLLKLFDQHLNDIIEVLFEKVGIDESIDFFGISRNSMKIIQIISFIFDTEALPLILTKIESILSNPSNSEEIEIICSLRTFSKVLSIKNRKLIYNPSLFDAVNLAIESSMRFIQNPEFLVDSAILFSKSLKLIFFIQNIQCIQNIQYSQNFQYFTEFDINSIGNDGFKQLFQAYSENDTEIKKKLAKPILSIQNYCQIPLHLYLSEMIQMFTDSSSLQEYAQNSYFLGKFIEKSVYLNEETDLQTEFQELVEFLMNSMSDEFNFFFFSSIHIMSASIVKCNELTPFVVSSLWSKIIEFINSFESTDSISLFQYGNVLNYESISTFSWIMQFMIDLNRSSFLLNYDSIELFEPILKQIQIFLNPEMPKSVNRAAWMLLNNLVEFSIKSLNSERIEEEQYGLQTKMLSDLIQIVKNSLFQLFSYLFEDNESETVEEDGFDILLINVIGIIAQTIFLILKELFFGCLANDEEENGFDIDLIFSSEDEIKMAVSALFHLFKLEDETGTRNLEADQAVTCCVSLLMRYPGGAEQIIDIVDADLMTKLFQYFSSIKDIEVKQLIALGISTIYAEKCK